MSRIGERIYASAGGTHRDASFAAAAANADSEVCGKRTTKVLPGSCALLQHKNFATMCAYDAVADAQSEPGPFSHLFGCKERIEDPFRFAYPGAVVDKCYFHGILRPARANANLPVIARLLYGIVSVVQNIQENLLQLLAISQRWRDAFIKLLDYFHTMAGKIVAAKLDCLPQDRVDLYRFALGRALPARSSADPGQFLLCAGFPAE